MDSTWSLGVVRGLGLQSFVLAKTLLAKTLVKTLVIFWRPNFHIVSHDRDKCIVDAADILKCCRTPNVHRDIGLCWPWWLLAKKTLQPHYAAAISDATCHFLCRIWRHHFLDESLSSPVVSYRDGRVQYSALDPGKAVPSLPKIRRHRKFRVYPPILENFLSQCYLSALLKYRS